MEEFEKRFGNPMVEKGVFTSQEQMYLEDQAIFLESFFEKGLGRPQFEGKVKRGDIDATNFWINHIPKVIDHYSFQQTVAVFAYISDLSTDELRGSGFYGLTTGNDKDIHLLRKSLLKKMLSFQSPSKQKELDQIMYIYHFNNLFATCVGFIKADSFRKKNGDNDRSSPEDNPYLRINPDIKFKKMIEIMRYTLFEELKQKEELNLSDITSSNKETPFSNFSQITEEYLKKKDMRGVIEECEAEFGRLIDTDSHLEPFRSHITTYTDLAIKVAGQIKDYFQQRNIPVTPERIKEIHIDLLKKGFDKAKNFPLKGEDAETKKAREKLISALSVICDIAETKELIDELRDNIIDIYAFSPKITELFSYILGENGEKFPIFNLKVEEALALNLGDQVVFVDQFTTMLRKLQQDAQQKLEESCCIKSDKSFLQEIRVNAEVIQIVLKKYSSVDFKVNSPIWNSLKELKGIKLCDILKNDQHIRKEFEKSINVVSNASERSTIVDFWDEIKKESNQNNIFKKIIDNFWGKYSHVFILKQRIDKYELQSDPPYEYKEFLTRLNDDLMAVCALVKEIFEIMGITPMDIKWFETRYDPSKHFDLGGSLLRSDKRYMKVLKDTVDTMHRAGDDPHTMIWEVLNLGYTSILEGVPNKKSEVVYYQDTESSYNHYFGDLTE